MWVLPIQPDLERLSDREPIKEEVLQQGLSRQRPETSDECLPPAIIADTISCPPALRFDHGEAANEA